MRKLKDNQCKQVNLWVQQWVMIVDVVISELLQFNYMSFCQKHTNHHCIHAHNCSSHNHKICDPNKKKSNKKSEIPRILCRDSGPLKKITERNHDNSSCSFNNSLSPNHHNKCQNCANLNKLLEESRKEVTDVRKQKMELDGKYRKMYDQNRQLSGVVEYYRGEIDRISKCSQQDVRTQIRKHMKQHTQLSAKNKYLLSKLHQLQLKLQQSQSQLEQSSHLLSTTVQKNNQLAQSNTVLYQKLKKLHKSECELKQNCQSLGKQHKNSKNHLQILIKQSHISVDKNQKQNRKLQKQNKELKAELEVMRVKVGNVEKLGAMEAGMLREREVGLKGKIGELGKEIGGLRESVADLDKKLKLKQEQLQYSKKVIQKQLNQLKQTKKLSQHLQQNSPLNPQQHPCNSTQTQKQNKVPQFPNNPNEQSYTEIKQLTQKIRLLQLQLQKQRQKSVPSSQAIEQYILTIGASEAFRKIIEEKNVYIKRLIREKGEILRALP